MAFQLENGLKLVVIQINTEKKQSCKPLLKNVGQQHFLIKLKQHMSKYILSSTLTLENVSNEILTTGMRHLQQTTVTIFVPLFTGFRFKPPS